MTGATKLNHLTIYSSLPMQVYMIHAIKKPILESVGKGTLRAKIQSFKTISIAFGNIDKLPEPTAENTWHPNSHNLLLLRAWFLKHWFIRLLCLIPPVKRLLHRITKGVIILYDFDPPWRWILDSVKDKALAGYDLRSQRDYMIEHCRMQSERDVLIKVVFDFLIVLHFIPPWRQIINSALAQAKKMDWKPRGFEDSWQYGWWKE
jgi:hypothetical protein